MSEHVTTDPLPEQTAQIAARLKRLMLIAGLTTGLGIGAVFVAIGYKLYRGEGVAAADATIVLPKGARIVSTASLGDRLALTLDLGGTTEIRTYDAKTFKMLGRARFAVEP